MAAGKKDGVKGIGDEGRVRKRCLSVARADLYLESHRNTKALLCANCMNVCMRVSHLTLT